MITTAARPRRGPPPQSQSQSPEAGGGSQGTGQRRRGRRGGRGRGRGDAPAAGPRDNSPPRESAGPRDDSGRGAGVRPDSHRSDSGRPPAGGRGGRGEGRPRDDQPRPRGSSVPVDEEALIPGVPDEFPIAPNSELQDPLDLAGSTLRDILTLLGLTETDITARDPETAGDGEGLIAQVFDIYGNDDDTAEELGVLIGRRGETLGNLQYLLNTIVSRREKDGPIYGLDIEGYRRRREQQLIEMAREVAAEVRATGDVITLEPMPAAERRIIHLSLQDEDGVKTESVGSGEHRQIEIMPA